MILEENIDRTLFDINHKILYDPTPRAMEINMKINKLDLMKLKNFCTAKETSNKGKGNLLDRRKCLQII